MEGYQLQPNEAFIMETEHVIHESSKRDLVTLVLTSQNIVAIKTKGLFKKTYLVAVYPINQIKVFNEQAQAIVNKSKGSSYTELRVFFTFGLEVFSFEKKIDAKQWAKGINQLVTGDLAGIQEDDSMMIPGAAFIAESLKDTLDTFKSAFYTKEKPLEIAVECSACKANFTGYKGQVVTCPYCRTMLQL